MNTVTVEQDQMIPYQQSVDEVLTALDTDAQSGLSEEEVRLGKFGKNELTAEKLVPDGVFRSIQQKKQADGMNSHYPPHKFHRKSLEQ
jgi:hypothetical protein